MRGPQRQQIAGRTRVTKHPVTQHGSPALARSATSVDPRRLRPAVTTLGHRYHSGSHERAHNQYSIFLQVRRGGESLSLAAVGPRVAPLPPLPHGYLFACYERRPCADAVRTPHPTGIRASAWTSRRAPCGGGMDEGRHAGLRSRPDIRLRVHHSQVVPRSATRGAIHGLRRYCATPASRPRVGARF